MSSTAMSVDLLVRARRIVVDGKEQAGDVAVVDGRIVDLLAHDSHQPARVEERLSDDEVLIPGLVDTHVHVNEPGRTEWEGFDSATAAAAAGGVTTIVDMPLNSVPPTTDVPALEVKRKAATGSCRVDVGFWGGAVPANLADLPQLWRAGVLGFKCFLVDSGVEEFPPLSTPQLRQVMQALAELDAVLLVHAEDPDIIASAPHVTGLDYASFLASRPDTSEAQAVERLLTLAADTGARVHVLHLSSATSLPLIEQARRDGVAVTAETCPHYLVLAAEDVPDGATAFKCCPPIRDSANREALWDGLGRGVVDLVVSDHSPCPEGLKAGGFGDAWGGVSSLQLGLPVMWTAARARGFGLAEVCGWMSAAPARFAGLSGKGSLAPGHDADLVAFAPDETFTVEAGTLRHRHPVTPYAGARLRGVVRRTWLRGLPVRAAPEGRLLSREEPR